MLKSFLPLVAISLFFLSACETGNSSDPNSTGKGSEILVVCDKVQWDGTIGNTIKGAFTQDMDGLPESEAEYSLINVPYSSFSNFLRTHRNVLILDLKPENGKSRIETQKNTWSHPQRVIKLIASNDTAFLRLFEKYKLSIKELFNQNERARFSAENALRRNLEVESALEKDFGIKMIVSADFYQAKKKEDFMWLRKETKEMSLGLLIYAYPYKDTTQMRMGNILAKRNEYTRDNIPGPAEGSYMVVAEQVIIPVSRKVSFNGNFAIETRGLWETHGDFMGGPFINYAVVDTVNQRVVVFDGYVYYPNKSKRNFIRQLESIIWGATFVVNPTVATKK
jgi:hypothetical protein